MEMNRAVNTRSRSKTLYYSGLVAAIAFLIASQVMLSVLIPASGVIPSPSLIALGSVLTMLSVGSTLVMIYSMMLRRNGQ